MVALQILSYILQKQDDSILTDNQITPDYFLGYEAEINFITAHKEKYGNVPDNETYLEKFPYFEILSRHDKRRAPVWCISTRSKQVCGIAEK